ncbi:MAG: hypothetical protein AB7Q81_24930 [Gammaproteobacteria bacterium]
MPSPCWRPARFLAVMSTLLLAALPAIASALEVGHIEPLLARLGIEAVGAGGQWRAVVAERAVMVIADEASGRLRIQAHVTAADALDEALLRRVLEADFGSAVDARYAIGGTTLWSLYVDDLADVDAARFAAALAQIANLAASFGHEYASGIAPDGRPDTTPRGALIAELVQRASAANPE